MLIVQAHINYGTSIGGSPPLGSRTYTSFSGQGHSLNQRVPFIAGKNNRNMKISIIVRFHNEEVYLAAVMEALTRQTFQSNEYEIIAVDNRSTDSSREIAARYTTNILDIDNYHPGKALNIAIDRSKGRNIAVLSAHAIPSNRTWLETLYAHMNDPLVAGVYGAQVYPINSRFLDKRDLDIFSSLEPRVEKKDSDFWNANSMFSRSVWERQPFEETIIELEDHYWTKQVLPMGYEVHFESAAVVYHYGHIERLDREYLADSTLDERVLIEAATDDLESDGNWPTTMKAGMTISSLTHSPHIKRSIDALGRRLLTHPDFDVRWRMAQALGKIPHETSVDYLIKALADPSFYPRDEAAWSLARIGRISGSKLMARLKDLTYDSIPFAALALGRSGGRAAEEQAVGLLLEEMKSSGTVRQCNAVYFAGEIAGASTSEQLIRPIEQLLETADTKLQAVSCWALGCYAQEFHQTIDWKQIEFLSKDSTDLLTRFEAVVALGKLALVSPKSYVLNLLMSSLSDIEGRVRYGAIQSIRRFIEVHKEISLSPDLLNWQDDDFGVMYELNLIKKLIDK